MEDTKNDTEELTLQPLPIETDDVEMKGMEEEEEVALIPLPIDETTENAEDTEMKNNEQDTSQDHDQSDAAPQAQPTELEIDEKEDAVPTATVTEEVVIEEVAEEEGGIVEEQEEEGGIIEEEEEDGGQVVMTHSNENDTKPTTETQAQTQTQTTSTSQATQSQQKPQPKSTSASKEAKEKEDTDKDRPKFHQITTTESEQRFLNIHLMKEWSNGEVLQWLTHRFGLWGQQYVPTFRNQKVDGQRLSQLSKEELKTEFGVTKPLHLVRICRDIEDAARPLRQINKLIRPCYVDGGNAASKLMRFSPKEVHEFANQLADLKPYANHFLNRQINGRVLLEASDVQLVTAMKDESITLVHAQSIVENIDRIKNEERLDRKTMSETEYAPIKAVYDVWTKMCQINEIRFKLLPQHIRDWSKPAPTYQPPPVYQHTYGQNGAYQHPQSATPRAAVTHGQPAAYGVNPAYQRQEVQPRARVTPMHEVKDVMEWTTEDCVNWLGSITDSKVDLRVRYTPHFEQVKMTGPVLLNMTPSTLSSVCCITTKTHLKVLVKAIDRIRDHLVFRGFAQLPHVKEFTRKYGGGFNYPPIHYEATVAGGYKRETVKPAAVQHVQAIQPAAGASSGSDGDSVSDRNTGRGGQPRRMSLEEQKALAQPSAKAQANIDAGEIRKRRKHAAGGDGDGAEQKVMDVKHSEAETKKEEQKSPQTAAAVAACFVCGKTGNVMRCSQCKAAFYCSREHQVNDWSRHSKECNK